jgi:type I restriction enzyme R subunit
LRSALRRLNPEVPPATIDTAVLQLSNPNVPGLLAANRQMHRWLTAKKRRFRAPAAALGRPGF